jgi:RNA polymerase sigma-70 factor (ECF subfamily)
VPTDPGEITQLLQQWRTGDRQAQSRLFQLLLPDLQKIAGHCFRGERPGHTLQPTALVNEAFIRLNPGEVAWENRRHFFGAAAQAMRRILVDHARQKQADKRGDGMKRITLSDLDIGVPETDLDVLAVNDALDRLAAEDPRLAEMVNLRFFAGMSIADTAQALDMSPATVKRDWVFARLYEQIEQHR